MYIALSNSKDMLDWSLDSSSSCHRSFMNFFYYLLCCTHFNLISNINICFSLMFSVSLTHTLSLYFPLSLSLSFSISPYRSLSLSPYLSLSLYHSHVKSILRPHHLYIYFLLIYKQKNT